MRKSIARWSMTLLMGVLTSVGAWAQSVAYMEYNTTTKAFDTKTCETYTTLTDQTAWTEGWYVVSGEVTIETRISVMGDVHLILADGATLNATKGIACLEDNSITIYGQSSDEATMGVLECGQSLLTTLPEYGYAAIGGENTTTSPVNGTITIHGGKVLAHGTAYGAAIGGGYGNQNNKKDYGTIIINGGIVSADNGSTKSNGQCPAVIGGGTYMTRGHITINGGTVTAYNSNGGGQGAKIGAGTESSWGIITINGGTISASGFMGTSAGNMGAGIGGGVFLTKDDDMTDPDLDQIIITGGTINASAAYGGAAIGGGLKGKCGTIRISGGNVTANAGLAAAAIGNGNGVKVNEGNIIITGGVVNAAANASNARSAIGASQSGYGPTITLGWTDEDNDRITATTTSTSMTAISGSSVTVVEDKAFTVNGVTYSGTLTTEQLTTIGSETWIPAVSAGYGTDIAFDNMSRLNGGYTESFTRDNGVGSYVDVPETEWSNLPPGKYRLVTVETTYIQTEDTDNPLVEWDEYYFYGGMMSGTDYKTGDYTYYFTVTENMGHLQVAPNPAELNLVPLTITESAEAVMNALNLKLSLYGTNMDMRMDQNVYGADPAMLESGRSYAVITTDELVFTGATITEVTPHYYGSSVTYEYTILLNADATGLTIDTPAPVSITLSEGADAVCEMWDYQGFSGGEGGWGWSGNGSNYKNGTYTFYDMGEELVITGATNVQIEDDNFTYSFTAEPGAVIEICLASELQTKISYPAGTENLFMAYVAAKHLQLPTGLKAYVVTAVEGNDVQVNELSFIPSGVPVLLQRSDKQTYDYLANDYEGTVTLPATNMLHLSATASTSVVPFETYVLFNDEFVLNSGAAVAAGRAFLMKSEFGNGLEHGDDEYDEVKKRIVIVKEDETTAIAGVNTVVETKGWFTIHGVKLNAQPSQRGIYIHDGKKVVVR